MQQLFHPSMHVGNIITRPYLFLGEEKRVWEQLVSDLTNHVLALPNFKGRSNYNELGRWCTTRYCCLQREGPMQWVSPLSVPFISCSFIPGIL